MNFMNLQHSFCVSNVQIKIFNQNNVQFNTILIGNASSISIVDKNYFNSSTLLSNFEDAKHLIRMIQLNKYAIPDAIFVNIPISMPELEDFGMFIDTFPRLKNIPLIYCSRNVTLKDFSFLKLSEFVDEVVDLESFGVDLYKKISFLKKVKNHPPAPFLRRSDHIEQASKFMSDGYVLKRAMDILVSATILLLCFPIFILIAIAIKLESKGPVFYNALRAGRKYKVFKFHKFRSMVVDAEAQVNEMGHLNQYSSDQKGVTFLKIQNDPRVTKVGKFLRKTSLDELPQMFNVLKGDMSLVGNRPLPLREAETLVTNDYIERFMAPAGITGLWQITKKGKPNMTIEERVDLDIVYAQRSNLLNDFKIILKTPAALIQNFDN
jgi:lipopolysaccharide/colanic/teichoic acid biosynthesis glycosyltransferase